MFTRFLPLLAAVFLVASCDSAEERAENHFQGGLELYGAGDVARAIIELRNVFKLNETHRGARMLMAEIEEVRGNVPSAYSQYSAVIEQDPEDFEALRAAARTAAALGNWKAAERHARAAQGLLADSQSDPLVQTIVLGVDYQKARREHDPSAARRIAGEAAILLEADPSLAVARQILIDDRFFREDWEAALVAVDGGLAQTPNDRALYVLRLAALEQLGREDAIEAQLLEMIDRFAEDESLPQMLVRWYISQNRIDDAESYLRAQIDPADANPQSRSTLIAFLSQVQGTEAALAEVERILAKTRADDPNRALYRAAQAGLLFEQGDHKNSVAEMQDILAAAEPSDLTRRIKIALAKMYVATGNPVAARALIEEVLSEDKTNVDALKMRAAWKIDDDRPEEALVDLRSVLDEAPRDPDALTLMAQAHERTGSRELMGEMLALAVEASLTAPDESLRYAAFLVQEERLQPAERVLIDALRQTPGHLQILGMLGDIYIRLGDWGRAQGVIDALKRQNDTNMADRLTARLLAGQDQQEELRAFLEQLAEQDGANQAVAAVIRLKLLEGDTEGALAYLQDRLAEAPEDPDLKLIHVALLVLEGNWDQAREILEGLIEEDRQSERLWLALYNLHRTAGNLDQASEALTAALAELPKAISLNWARAGELEVQGDIEGAIAIYEDIYARHSNIPVIANNLASLISSFRDDQESLQRAYTIARRLHGTKVPQFQDTYGWIVARLGRYEEALEYLRPAAEALPQDPTVRFHLARTLGMAGHDSEALEAYRAATRLLEESDRHLPFQDEITAEIMRLEKSVAVEN